MERNGSFEMGIERKKPKSRRARREDAERSLHLGLFLVVVYQSCDPVPQHRDVKVDQQSYWCFEQAHVRENLRMIYRVQDFLTFEFDNHLTLD